MLTGVSVMTWILIIGSLIVLWIASLVKILHSSPLPSNDVFLSNGLKSGEHSKRNVLLVVAHPDDESMAYQNFDLWERISVFRFFSPTISYLTSRGYNVHILCLSTGNADSKGNIRKQELYQACAVLKVLVQQVKCVDHPELQDGFGKVWDHKLLARIIGEEVGSHGIKMIITFDSHGVSGHCNHRDVYYGIRKFLLDSTIEDIIAWELVSTNLVRKYSGPVDIWLSYFLAKQRSKESMLCLVNEHPRNSFLAMSQHISQWVWFRKLFVAFSSYSYVNTLLKINA